MGAKNSNAVAILLPKLQRSKRHDTRNPSRTPGQSQRLTIAPRTLENMVKHSQFPAGVRVGKRIYWSELAVRKWQLMLFAGQEAWQP